MLASVTYENWSFAGTCPNTWHCLATTSRRQWPNRVICWQWKPALMTYVQRNGRKEGANSREFPDA